MRLLRTVFSRRWWWVTLLVIALMAVLARLGVWQLDRLQQRREANAVVAASLAAPPFDLNSTAVPDDISEWDNRLIAASGTFDHEREVLLQLQNWGYRAGVNLITPLVLDDGQTAVLVNRGWIPEAESASEARAAYNVPGEVTIDGYVALSEKLSREPMVTPQGPQSEVFRVDVEAIQAQVPYTLLPFYIVQDVENDNEQLPFRLERQIDLSEGSHLSYAMQWFIFSIGLGVAYLVFVNRSIGQVEQA
jgi:surfeit locus 1 family protein